MKRLMDIVVSAALLAVLCPLLLCIGLLIGARMGWPVFFAQPRPGLNGRVFRLVKFRTMTDARDAVGNLLPDGERLPPLGRFLRSTSFDELPELWNVLTGDMSIVGPRPLLVEYLPLYNERQAHRHDVRPGITGLAQVNGRNALSWEEKFELDVKYVETHTLRMDFAILLRTMVVIFKRDGITHGDGKAMPVFTGSPK